MEPIERTLRELNSVDARITSVLLPYGVPLAAYFATVTRREEVAPLPCGVVDATEFLVAHAQLTGNAKADAQAMRSMGVCWRCAFVNRHEFEANMTPLLHRRYELEIQLCLAKAHLAMAYSAPVPGASP